MTEEDPQREKLSLTGLRIAIAAVVVVGLVFLGDALDDGGDSVSAPVWPVVRAAEGSCGLAAQPIRRSGAVRFSALCDLENRPVSIRLTQTEGRDEAADSGEEQVVQQVLLSQPGSEVGQVFRGPRSVGRCIAESGEPPSVGCSPTTSGPFPRRFQVRIAAKVRFVGCGPKWKLIASYGPKADTKPTVTPVIWRGCGATPVE